MEWSIGGLWLRLKRIVRVHNPNSGSGLRSGGRTSTTSLCSEAFAPTARRTAEVSIETARCCIYSGQQQSARPC